MGVCFCPFLAGQETEAGGDWFAHSMDGRRGTPAMRDLPMTRLSGYVLETVLQEGDCVLYRARRDDADQSRVLVVAPVAEPCGAATLRGLEHEYAFRTELDPAWAARPLALLHSDGRTVLLLEDCGGDPLTRLLGRPLELTHFLHLAIEISA